LYADLNKWKDIPCSWIGRFNVVNMSVLPKLIDRFNIIPIKVSTEFSVALDKLVLKFIWKGKGIKIAKTILEKNTF